ncbi:MAG: AgmX/PglI C-terminal domain-containing protein [Deltaproteobacteria bacterium]|nr:AgmX/PglI C-terminal domain-containing protein [Deltaproteobacteria bacterium]
MPQPDAPRVSIPSKLPSSGSSGTPYIIASVLLVVVIVVVLWFKFRKNEVQAPPPVVSSAPVNTVQAPAFDLPPPPEIEAGPDADTDAGGRRPTNAGGGGLCASPCQGTDTPALSSAMRGAAGSSRGCYERALRTNSMLQGRLKVGVRVAANGTVCSASIVEDGMHSAEVSSCVLGLFRGRPFPAPAGGSCVDVTIPLSFTPQEGKK